MSDFSGGEISAKSSLEPAENQWLALVGFVLDNNRRLRAQWAGANWNVEIEQIIAIPLGPEGESS